MATARQLIQSGVGMRSKIKASHLLNRGKKKGRVAADFDIIALSKYMDNFHPAGTKQVGGKAKDIKAIKRSFRETKGRVSRQDRVLPSELSIINNDCLTRIDEHGNVMNEIEVSKHSFVEPINLLPGIRYKSNIKHKKPFRA